jgi:hypothetical protein
MLERLASRVPGSGGGDRRILSRHRYGATWLALTALLGLELRYDFLRVLDPAYKAAFQLDSDSLVSSAMASTTRPWWGTLMYASGAPYTSQFGLQGMVMSLLSPGMEFYGLFRVVTATLAGAVLAAAVVAAWRAWGGRAASLLLVLLATSYWLNVFAVSTYWQLWTLLLPALVPLLVWHRLGEGRRKWLRGGALIAAVVFLKCLNGYEYISTILLSAAAGVAFHEFRGRLDLRLLRTVVGACLAGLVGFVAALAINIVQLVALDGTAANIWQRVVSRTFKPSEDVQMVFDMDRSWHDPVWGWLIDHSNSPFRLWLFQAIHYLISPAIDVPNRHFLGLGPVQYGVPVWAFIALWALLAWQAFRGRQADAAIQRRLAVASGIGLVGAASWLVLAYGHMVFHLHLDTIVFYLPFLPLVLGMIALRLQTISLRAWPHRAALRGDALLRRDLLPPVPPRRERDLADVGGRAVDHV